MCTEMWEYNFKAHYALDVEFPQSSLLKTFKVSIIILKARKYSPYERTNGSCCSLYYLYKMNTRACFKWQEEKGLKQENSELRCIGKKMLQKWKIACILSNEKNIAYKSTLLIAQIPLELETV